MFVGNLPWSTTEADLSAFLAAYGDFDVRLKTSDTGRSRGFALVTFATTGEASQAIANLQGVELEGRVMEVRADRKPGDRKAGGSARKQGAAGSVVAKPKERAEPFRGHLVEAKPSVVLFVHNLS